MNRSNLIVCALGFAVLLGTLVSRADAPAKDKLAGPKAPTVDKKTTRAIAPPARRTGAEAIEAALLEECPPCEFSETPLKDVLDYIRDATKIQFWLDEAGLKEEGVEPDTPISCDLRGCRLASVLAILLDKLQLAWTIHDDVLWITSRSKAESFHETRVYDVADLVVYRDKKGSQADDYEPLIDIITDIEPATWDHNGGRGSIRGATLGNAKVLLITQTRDVHKEIAGMLSQVRTIGAKSGGDGVPRHVSPRRRGDTDKQPSPRATNQQS